MDVIVDGAPINVWPLFAETVSVVTVWLVLNLTFCPSYGAAGMTNVPDAKVPAGLIT